MIEANPKCTDCPLSDCIVNKHCSDQWKRLAEVKKSTGLYQKRQAIFNENNIAFGIYILYSGKAKIFNTINSKTHQILRFIAPGNCIGFTDFSVKTHHTNCSAVEDSVLCFFERDFFSEVIDNNSGIAIELLNYCTREILSLQLRFRHLSQINTRGRIAETLLLMNCKYGIKDEEKYLLDTDITRQDIADIACTAYAETIRVLSEMKKQKVIETNGHQILILQKSKLLEMVLDHCSAKERVNYSAAFF